MSTAIEGDYTDCKRDMVLAFARLRTSVFLEQPVSYSEEGHSDNRKDHHGCFVKLLELQI